MPLARRSLRYIVPKPRSKSAWRSSVRLSTASSQSRHKTTIISIQPDSTEAELPGNPQVRKNSALAHYVHAAPINNYLLYHFAHLQGYLTDIFLQGTDHACRNALLPAMLIRHTVHPTFLPQILAFSFSSLCGTSTRRSLFIAHEGGTFRLIHYVSHISGGLSKKWISLGIPVTSGWVSRFLRKLVVPAFWFIYPRDSSTVKR